MVPLIKIDDFYLMFDYVFHSINILKMDSNTFKYSGKWKSKNEGTGISILFIDSFRAALAWAIFTEIIFKHS